MSGNELDQMTRLNNELLNAQRELHRINRQLESLNREKNQAIGVVAHDLRNPLGLIQMCSELLMGQAQTLDADQRELLRMIRHASAFMATMVNDVLDLSAIESGTLRLKRQVVDFFSYVSRNVERNRMLARASEVGIDLAPAPVNPILVEIDPDRFEQVLNNLLTNAVTFSASGARVEVRTYQQDGQAVVCIRDHGPGIPPEEIDKLFRPFVRGREGKREGSGSGLGLAIVKRVVEGHGGRIEVKSKVGVGTTFYVRLPLAR